MLCPRQALSLRYKIENNYAIMHIYLNLKVLQEEGFNLLGLATFILTFHQAEEFLDVYRCIGCLLNSVCKNIHQRSC